MTQTFYKQVKDIKADLKSNFLDWQRFLWDL